ncbi:MAG TPA: TolC family protein [Flavisolibacter sp.]|jgi:outer membrane protein TolC|nr:TolC family protein [Flavisolibacter sp.]
MKSRILFAAALFMTALSGNAQNRILTLNEAIATSLQNNYDIQLFRNDSSLAALDYAFANYALLPRLSANGGSTFNNNNQKQVLADGTKRESNGIRSNNLAATLNLDWTLFDGFRMFIAKNRLGKLVELGELQVKGQVVTTVAEVMRIYYDIIRQEQQLRALEEQMELNEERLKIAQYKFDIGTGAKPDVLQAQIDLNAQRSAALTQQTAINKIKEQLNALLVVPTETNFEVADSTIDFNAYLTLDSIRSDIKNVNPELLIAQKNIDLATLDLRLRRAERLPVVEFNSAYNFSRTDNKSVINPFQPLFNQNKGLNYGFSASIPIFNGFTNRRLQRAAQINIESQQLIYERSATQINASIANAYRDYDLSKRALALEEQTLVLVRENIFIARERYRLGISTFIELREAQQSLADATNRLIQARYNTKAAEIELLRLRGDLVR